jgi:hypothetical protein
VRYICLVALLFVLPITASAQQRRQNDRRSDDRQSSDRRTDQRRSDQGRSDQGRSAERRSDQRQTEQTQSNQRPTTGLSPLGLPPASTPRTPWWEQRQVPAWERQQVPAWERPQVPAWETKNPARTLLDRARDERRLAKTPRPLHSRPAVVYVLPPYRYFDSGTTLSYGVATSTGYITPPPPQTVITQPQPPPVIETGFLRLEVEPRMDLQVFVDGLFIGTIADLGDELELRLGIRRIELRAPGHRTLVFDTEIVPDRTIVYRGALEPISNAPPARREPSVPAAPLAPEAPKAPASNPIYLIPGCYLGNVLPTAAMMRPGCDISKLTTISR